MRGRHSDDEIIRLALAEDIGDGDITTKALALKGKRGKATVIAKEAGILSGIKPFKQVFKSLSRVFSFNVLKHDGSDISAGDQVVFVTGPLDFMLTGERTAMNILCHLSGVASLTNKYVREIGNYPAEIFDTRKTMPGMRAWEKKAVRDGGGINHRMGLYDMYLVKENHITAEGGIDSAITKTIRHRRRTRAGLEVEVKNLAELKVVLPFKPDFILLDNFTISNLKKAVELTRMTNRRIILEASGNVNLRNIQRIAATGVHRISIGKLTHSAAALDLSFMVLD